MINLVAKKAHQRVGSYYYYFPTLNLGRKILWDGMDKTGFKFINHIPEQLIERKSEQEMQIRLKNGSVIQIMGTDKAEVVGPNPVGCVFSEYSLQDPSAWDFVRPILAENGGWAVFLYTPRGMNHGYKLFQMAQGNPEWFSQVLTVDDTQAINKAAIEFERRSGMSDELIEQEFFCSWEYGLEGAYYLKQIAKARKEGRICDLPIMDRPVFTAWDLGHRDATAIWFWQEDGPWFNLIDYYENSGEYLGHYAKVLAEKPYLYGRHYVPHDAGQKRLHARAMVSVAKDEFGLDLTVLNKENSVQTGIEVVRSVFPRCRFDKTRTEKGLNAAMNYQKEYNEKLQCFREYPLDNWAAHGADALRYFARAVTEMRASSGGPDEYKELDYPSVGTYTYGK